MKSDSTIYYCIDIRSRAPKHFLTRSCDCCTMCDLIAAAWALSLKIGIVQQRSLNNFVLLRTICAIWRVARQVLDRIHGLYTFNVLLWVNLVCSRVQAPVIFRLWTVNQCPTWDQGPDLDPEKQAKRQNRSRPHRLFFFKFRLEHVMQHIRSLVYSRLF